MKDMMTAFETAVRQPYPRPLHQLGVAEAKWWAHFTTVEAVWLAGGAPNVNVRKGAQGRWLHGQRQLYKHGKLLPERQIALEYLGVWWSRASKPKVYNTPLVNMPKPQKRARRRRPKHLLFLKFRRPTRSKHTEVVTWWRIFGQLEKMVVTSETGEMGDLTPEQKIWVEEQQTSQTLSKNKKKALIYIGVLLLG